VKRRSKAKLQQRGKGTARRIGLVSLFGVFCALCLVEALCLFAFPKKDRNTATQRRTPPRLFDGAFFQRVHIYCSMAM
jgi:hypothetical protein